MDGSNPDSAETVRQLAPEMPARPGPTFRRMVPQGAPEVDLAELLRIIWRRKGLLIGTVVVLTALAALVVLQQVPRYTARVLVMIDSRETNVVDVESVLSGISADSEAIAGEVQILQSRRLAERVITRLRLARFSEFNPELARRVERQEPLLELTGILPNEWLEYLSGVSESAGWTAEEEAERNRTGIVDRFAERLRVVPVGRSRVIAIEFESETARLAARIANTLADEYVVDQLEAKFEATERATTWLNERLAELRTQVEVSEGAVEQYRAASGLIQGVDATLISQQISEVSSQLIVARAELAEAEARRSQVQELMVNGGVESVAEVLESLLIQRLREQEAELLRRQAELSTEFGPRHPVMTNLVAEVAGLQGRIAGEVNKVVENLETEMNVARARLRTIESDLALLEAKAVDANRAEVRLRALEREAEANRSLFEQFLGRFKETSGQEGLEQPDARIISDADVPLHPSSPKTKLILALAFVTSGIIGLMLVAVMERLDSGFRSTEQIEQDLGVSALGLVPVLSNVERMRYRPDDYVLQKPMSAYAEAIRSLRTSLLLSDVDNPPRVVMVTSTVPGEGKTTLALSLARLTASMGEKTIIVDGDLRIGRLHKALNLEVDGGLVEYMAGEYELHDIIRTDTASDLHFIPAGRSTPNSAEILRSDQMRHLLRILRDRYDLVVIDAPPISAVSDARVLSVICDASLFAVRWKSTRRESVRHAMSQLASARGRIAGAVLTQVNVRQHARYGFGDSGFYYGKYGKYYTG